LNIDNARFEAARAKATQALLDARHPDGHWEGRLSSSALSTATSLGALAFVARQSSAPHPRSQELIDAGLKWLVDNVNDDGGWGDTDLSFSNISTTTLCWAAFAMADADARYPEIVKRAEAWLAKAAGGIEPEKLAPAIIRRYGKDKTFSVPILTMCVISGRMGAGRDAWRWVKQLPFELAAFPHKFFAALRLPVVSYALPALIAIGNARHARRPTWNPLTRWFRNVVRDKTLDKLKSIQPASGGFLEASPLTSFVAMSLAAAGQVGHPVTQKCVEFLVGNAREDGSWPIDTNLATWVTTLAVNALGNDPEFEFKEEEFGVVRDWLLDQQYKDVHPYTNAAPGGWAWTDLSGGVPDADDTAGALLALGRMGDPFPALGYALRMSREGELPPDSIDPEEPLSVVRAMTEFREKHETEFDRTYRDHVVNGSRWLLDLQNGDGGIPTFCKGWTNLPFDRSSPDITAHALRAWIGSHIDLPGDPAKLDRRFGRALKKGLSFLRRQRDPAGSWIPLWFGNQHEANDENGTYGTAKALVLGAELIRQGSGELFVPTISLLEEPGDLERDPRFRKEDAAFTSWQDQQRAAVRKRVEGYAEMFCPGVQWLLNNQQPDGGWGGGKNGPSSVEETALAVEALAPCIAVGDEFWDGFKSEDVSKAVERGVLWLIEKIEHDTWTQPAPIGFYFAKLWYYEDLYPITFTVAALNKVKNLLFEMDLDRAMELRRDLEM